MKTIMLYGALGKEFGRVHRYAVKTPAEAVRALCANFKGFRQAVEEIAAFRVVVGGESRDSEAIAQPSSDKETIRIIPVVQGAGEGFGSILAGAALIAASVAFPYASATFSVGTFSTSVSLSSAASAIGFSLVLGGVSQLLFAPQASKPEQYERPENRPSFFFNGAVNTSREGNCVPVCYGQMIVGSQVISSGLSVEQI